MARIRTIKPDLPLDEELAEHPYLFRYIFALMPMVVDKSGRVEDRPMMIKAKLLPYDDEDMNEILQALHDTGFITRYEEKGKKYIQVNTFERHQRPHHTERKSEIPEPKKLTKKGSGVTGREMADEDTDDALEEFKALAQKVQGVYPQFNPYAFVNKKSKKGKWPIQCFNEVFRQLLANDKVEDAHKLAEYLWKIYAGNVLEQLSIEGRKPESMEIPTQILDLVKGIGDIDEGGESKRKQTKATV